MNNEPEPNIIKLIIQCKNGNQRSFDELFHLYSGRIYRLAKNLRLEHNEAQEIVQDVFLIIWNRRSNLDPEKDFKAYIFKIAKSLIIKTFKKKSLHFAYQNYVISKSQSLDFNTEQLIDYHNLLEILENAIQSLPDGKKQIFLLSRNENLSNDEIALRLGISRRTVENQIYRTLKILKDRVRADESMLVLLLTCAYS